MNIKLLAATFVAFVAFFFLLLALGLPSWMEYSQPDPLNPNEVQKTNGGLWVVCSDILLGSPCVTPPATSRLNAVRAFMIIAMFPGLGSLAVAAMVLTGRRTLKASVLIWHACGALQAFCGMVSMSVWAAMATEDGASPHYGPAFALCIIGWLLPLGNMVLVHITSMMEGSADDTPYQAATSGDTYGATV